MKLFRVAREGFAAGGRGSVNLRLPSPHLAQAYISGGWRQLAGLPYQLLFYYTIPALVDERKDPSLIALCRKYDPQ